MSIVLVLMLFVIGLLLIAYKRKRFADSLPPGPPAWPIVGNLLQYDKDDMRKTLLEWHKKYGPMFTVWSGFKPEIHVTGYDLMHELFVKRGDEFADRPDDWMQEHQTSGKYGIINSSGEQMREQRRFTLQALRNFGFGKKIMEEKVTHEADKLLKSVEDKLNGAKSRTVNIKSNLELCIGNIISSLVVGRTYEPDDQSFHRLKNLISQNFQTLGTALATLLSTFPWLRFVPLFNHFGYDNMQSEIKQLNEIFLHEIEKHKHEIEETSEPNDFTAVYLQELRKRQDSGQNMGHFSEWQLVNIMGDLWAAGMETTVTTMGWAILLMMKYPKVQAKVHEELDKVLGFEKQPSLADKNELPYVSAVLHEIQRYANIAPTNFARRVNRDTIINGYTIPAMTTIIPQIPVVLLDDSIFPHPEEFLPERFLEPDMKTLKKSDQLIPFSLGKRSCLGESLARLELFIIFTFLMQKFTFSVDPNGPEPTLDPVVSFTVSTKPYDCLVSARF